MMLYPFFLLRRSTLLITTGLILWLGVYTFLEFFFPHKIEEGKIMIGLVGIGLLITGIAIFIQDKRNGSASYFSVKSLPVDIRQQTIFAFIPGLDLYASYKIKKLTLYFLIILSIGISLKILSDVFAFSYDFLIIEAIVLPNAIFLIRQWSKKWNEQFLENTTEEIK